MRSLSATVADDAVIAVEDRVSVTGAGGGAGGGTGTVAGAGCDNDPRPRSRSNLPKSKSTENELSKSKSSFNWLPKSGGSLRATDGPQSQPDLRRDMFGDDEEYWFRQPGRWTRPERRGAEEVAAICDYYRSR